MTIDRLAYGGEGVGRDSAGRVVFVPHTAPGDRILAVVTAARQRFSRARVLEWTARADCRTEPFCPHFTVCNGCHLQHLAPETQRREKQRFVADALERVGKVAAPAVADVQPPVAERGYRRHAAFAVGSADGRPVIGFLASDGRTIVPLENCPLLAPPLNAVLAACREWFQASPHAAALAAAVRFIDVRVNCRADEGTVLLWHRGRTDTPGGDLARHLRRATPFLRGVGALSPRGGRRQSGRRPRLFWGSGHLHEQTGAWRLQVSAQSFFQANPPEAVSLLHTVLAETAVDNLSVLELYAGVGFFTEALCARARRVVCVEGAPAAFRDLRRNVGVNRARNVEVRRGDAAREVERLLSRRETPPGLVWMNPPRTGAGTAARDTLTRLRAASVVYVSCDPATLARDVHELCAAGYALEWVRPFDLFPHTYHVETVVRLRRR